MTIATEKVKPQTDRETLVRLKPARHVGTSMASQGGGVYQMTWPLDAPVVEMKRNGTAMTKVASVSSNDDWSFDESTRILRVKTAAAPSTTNVVVAFYYLFYSSGTGKDYYQDPADPTSPLRNWEPRLIVDPSTKQDFANVLVGALEIQETVVSLSNTDGEFEQYLSTDDSFYQKEAKVWVFINGARQVTYSGKISRVSISGESFELAVYDAFTSLVRPARLDVSGEVEYITSAGTPKDLFKPVPLMLATTSWALLKTFALSGFPDSPVPSAGSKYGYMLEGLEAACNTFTENLTTSNNRSWTLMRSLGSLKTQTYGSITRVVNPSSGIFWYLKFGSYSNLRVGDTMKWTHSGTPYYGLIVGVGTFTVSGNTYDVMIAVSGAVTLTTGSTMNALKTLCVQVNHPEQSGIEPIFQGLHYTISETTQTSGTKLLKITFANNFEASVPALAFPAVLDPTEHRVIFHAENDGDYSHGVVLKWMLEKAGLTCNAASFTQADSDLVEKTAFSIPNIDETDYADWLKYVQDLLESTLGYTFLNNDGEVEYKIAEAPVAGDEKGDELVLDEADVQVEIEYQDIITELSTNNPHLMQFQPVTQTTRTNLVAKYLHEVNVAQTLRHVMASVDASRAQQILDVRCNRRVTYQHETASDDIDTVLGQDITLSSPRILGGGGSADVKVTGIEKSADKVVVKSSDLFGL